MKPTVTLTAALLCALSPICFAKTIKVFILAGQSNMQETVTIAEELSISSDLLYRWRQDSQGELCRTTPELARHV